MPRGVYARKSAQKVKPKAKAKPVVKKAAKAKQVAKPKASPPIQLVEPGFVVTPAFYRTKSVSVDTIGGDELKAYARSIGIMQRDVDGLSEDRLRQNCKARILSSMED